MEEEKQVKHEEMKLQPVTIKKEHYSQLDELDSSLSVGVTPSRTPALDRSRFMLEDLDSNRHEHAQSAMVKRSINDEAPNSSMVQTPNDKIFASTFPLPKSKTVSAFSSPIPIIPEDLDPVFNVVREPKWHWLDDSKLEDLNEGDELRVLFFTWNLFGRNCPRSVKNLIGPKTMKHHLVAFGTEECLRSIGQSLIYQSKREWEGRLSSELGHEYVKVGSHTLNAIHVIVFAHNSIVKLISDVESQDIATGLGNVIGNKGAVAVAFKLKGNSFIFLNCHLESGQNANPARYEDLMRIENNMKLPKNFRQTENNKIKLTDRYDFVFWGGDFNYRINMQRHAVLKLMAEKKYDVLLQNDQMAIEKNKPIPGNLLTDLQEGELIFVPTYKFDANTTYYDRSKKGRTPGWTDRVLYKYKKKGDSNVTLMSYDSINATMISDHRPVFAQFQVKLCEVPKNTIKLIPVKAGSRACTIF